MDLLSVKMLVSVQVTSGQSPSHSPPTLKSLLPRTMNRLLPLAKLVDFRVAAADSPPITQICMPPAGKSAQHEYHLAVTVEITGNCVIEVRSFIGSPS